MLWCCCIVPATRSGREVAQRICIKNPYQYNKKVEKIVIVGSMEGDHFLANKILLKCPSKYTDGEVKTADASK